MKTLIYYDKNYMALYRNYGTLIYFNWEIKIWYFMHLR